MEKISFLLNKKVDDFYRVSEADIVIIRISAAASNLLAKHKLNAITEADVRWLEAELKNLDS